ncbi:MAG: hypothetical protein K8R21_05400 [Leptospira sp.]|nr:hypothetical protein [Leptospira sp.]
MSKIFFALIVFLNLAGNILPAFDFSGISAIANTSSPLRLSFEEEEEGESEVEEGNEDALENEEEEEG